MVAWVVRNGVVADNDWRAVYGASVAWCCFDTLDSFRRSTAIAVYGYHATSAVRQGSRCLLTRNSSAVIASSLQATNLN